MSIHKMQLNKVGIPSSGEIYVSICTRCMCLTFCAAYRSIVEVEMCFLDTLAMVTLGVGQSKQPFFEEWAVAS